MKIEIVDREIWLDKIKTAVDNIIEYRKNADERYVNYWRKKTFLGFKLNRENKMPPHTDLLFGHDDYPSTVGWRSLRVLTDFGNALLTKGTGGVYVGKEEMESLNRWEDFDPKAF